MSTERNTILIVDDELVMQEMLDELLSTQGYSILKASNGKEGIDVAENNQDAIGCIILDIRMPILSGKEAFPILKETCPNAEIILCSGYELDDDMQLLTESGACSYLRKPFRSEQLFTTVKDGIANNQTE